MNVSFATCYFHDRTCKHILCLLFTELLFFSLKFCGYTLICEDCLSRLPREGVQANIDSIHHHACPICRGTIRFMPLKSDALQRTVGELLGLSTPRPEDMEIDDLRATRPIYDHLS